MGPILLIGAGGQLGSDLVKVLPAAALIPLKRADLDVTDLAAVDRVLESHRPAWVINTAAFHRVDDIERDPEATARILGICREASFRARSAHGTRNSGGCTTTRGEERGNARGGQRERHIRSGGARAVSGWREAGSRDARAGSRVSGDSECAGGGRGRDADDAEGG